MIAGQQLFAKVSVRLEPLDAEHAGTIVLTQCPPESLPDEILTLVLEELQAHGEGGGLIQGYPLAKLRITFLGGDAGEDVPNELAFKMAVSDAFSNGLEQGGKVLLEPIMKVDIVTPEDYVGDFVGDLQQRRAVIAKTENRGRLTAIEARVPLSNLFGYSSAMRSLSQGRAGCSIEPLEYAPAPREVMRDHEIWSRRV